MEAMQVTNGSTPPVKKRTLDDIVEEYIAELIAGEGEVTLKLDELDEELEDKAVAYQYAAKKLKAAMAAEQAQQAYYAEEVKRHKAREAAIDKEYERLKERLANGMRISGKTEIRTVVGKIRFQNFPVVVLPEGWAEKLHATDVANVYVKVVPESYVPKKELMLHDFKQLVKQFEESQPATSAGRKAAWEAALKMMPEGFSVDPNPKLMGV